MKKNTHNLNSKPRVRDDIAVGQKCWLDNSEITTGIRFNRDPACESKCLVYSPLN